MKDDTKKDKVNIRVTKKEKNKILKDAKKLDMSISDYSRMLLLSPNKKVAAGNVVISNLLVKSQEMVNYIHDTYNADDKLERMMEELWEIS
ncbi:MAG: hypothetical protein NC489_38710 [Ruminococcus flavefaciens]|nr:hypothetical protein [Ruminococcus flavefaciens]